MKIGFIGPGIMGKPMAKNLLKAGCDLVLTMLPNSPQVKSVMLGDIRTGR